MKLKTNAFLPWLILAILAVIWGSSFILIKYGLDHFSAAQVGSMRIVIAFLVLLPVALASRKRLKRADLLWLFLSGFLGYLIPSLLFAFAEQVVPSSVAGILNSLTPIFTLLVAVSLFGRKFSWVHTSGVLLGLVGAIGLMLSVNGGVVDVRIGYALLIVLATILYAFNLNIIKTRLGHLRAIDVTAFGFLLNGPLAVIHLFLFTPLFPALSAPGAEWGLLYIGILAVAGSAIALVIFNHLIKITNVIFSSSVTYLIPIVATLAGIADGESFKVRYLLWVVVILFGVFLVNKRPKA